MQSCDITESGYYIKNLIKVIRSEIKYTGKINLVKGRRSDAFVYVLYGDCKYSFEDGKEVDVKRGDVVYLSHNANYKMLVGCENYGYIYCDFQFDSDDKRSCEVFVTKEPKEIEHLFVKLLTDYRSATPSQRIDMMAILYEIYARLIRLSVEPNKSKSSEVRITDVKAFIDANFYDTNMNVSAIAERFLMSEVYMRKIFKNKYGRSPIEYITFVRLMRARELIGWPPAARNTLTRPVKKQILSSTKGGIGQKNTPMRRRN